MLEMPASDVIDQIRSRPDTLVELLGELSGRLTAIDGEFQSFVSDSALVRLGAKLLALASVSASSGDWLDLPHGFSHGAFAQMLGVHVRPSRARSPASGSSAWSRLRGADRSGSTDAKCAGSWRPQLFGERAKPRPSGLVANVTLAVMAAVMH